MARKEYKIADLYLNFKEHFNELSFDKIPAPASCFIKNDCYRIRVQWYDFNETHHSIVSEAYDEHTIVKTIIKIYNVAPRIKGIKITL